jgi:PhoPQ-activated pathogenicity-related protein
MRHNIRVSFAVPLVIAAVVAQGIRADEPQRAPVPTALFDYVSKPDPSYSWKITGTQDRGAERLIQVALTSQTWHGIVWKHALEIHEPKQLANPRHVLLVITGGKNGAASSAAALLDGEHMAARCGARLAVLHQVPNQPLLGNHSEDDLITETWLRYLESGDPTWPLLFPMVKSAMRSMDAVEAIVRQNGQPQIAGFVVTGASKRGWTTWLSAAADRRVIGIAPQVIDVLNFKPQMKHQLETWGKFSEQIADYTRKRLVKPDGESPREVALRTMMDPFTYRAEFRLPKLIINGTNDRYWAVDATTFYWDDLPGEKFALKIPNVGHGLGGGDLPGNTLAVFFRHVVEKSPLPKLEWSQGLRDGRLSMTVRSSVAPKAARVWYALSQSKDFRDSKWQNFSFQEENGVFTASRDKPNEHVAFFGELAFESHGLPYSLTTLVWSY